MPEITGTVETEVTLDFQVWCGLCGAGLCNNVTTRDLDITIDPCEACLEASKEDGDGEGYDRGYAEFVGKHWRTLPVECSLAEAEAEQ